MGGREEPLKVTLDPPNVFRTPEKEITDACVRDCMYLTHIPYRRYSVVSAPLSSSQIDVQVTKTRNRLANSKIRSRGGGESVEWEEVQVVKCKDYEFIVNYFRTRERENRIKESSEKY